MAKMDMFHSEIIGNNMRKLKKFAKASARLAVKASPIPIPEELTNTIGIQENKMDLIEERVKVARMMPLLYIIFFIRRIIIITLLMYIFKNLTH